MKPSKEEILIIFILAVLITILSGFFYVARCKESPESVEVQGLQLVAPPPWSCFWEPHGFPLSYGGRSHFLSGLFNFLLDVLFYLIIFSLGWKILRSIVRKIKK